MIIFLLFYALFARMFWRLTVRFYGKPDWGMTTTLSFFLGTCLSMLTVVALEIYKPNFEYRDIATPIYSVTLDDKSSGVFVLGKETVNHQSYFYFYERIDEETFKLNKLHASSVVVRTTDDINPSIVRRQLREVSKWKHVLSWPFKSMWRTVETTIIVPTNTLERSFRIVTERGVSW